MNTTNQMLAVDASTAEKKTFFGRMRGIWSEYSYLLLGALIPAVLFFLIYLARGLYPFGDGTVLVLDLNGQYVYFFEGLRDKVMNGGSLLYTWSRALGGEFLGMYAYYVASPLSYLICLFPKERTQEFLLIMFMIKAAICGTTMGYYLHKHSFAKNKLAVVAFSVLYAMSAYCVVHQNNTMWIDAVMWLPLITYGLEQLIKLGKYKMFTFFLALTLASNFYIGYMVCIFVFLYFFFYHAAFKDNNVNNPGEEKQHFVKSLVRTGVFSLLAIGMAAVIVLGAYYSLQFGKNEFTDPSWDIELRNLDLFDIFFKMLPSAYDTVRIDGLPFIYCGLLTAILAPLYFCCKKFTTREKVVTGIFLAIFILSFLVNVLDLVWHGFQKPQWLNNRYSFMFCFMLIVIAFKAFEHIEEISNQSIACVTAFIVLFVAALQSFATAYKDKLVALSYGPNEDDFSVHKYATIVLTLVCLAIFITIIALLKRPINRELVTVVMLGVICVEVFFSGLCNINDLDADVGYTKYYKYNEFQTLYRPVTDTLQDYDTSFYRAEKTYHRKLNDNFALSLNGLSNSTSTLNKDTITFLHSLGYYSVSHKSQYLGGNVVSDSLVGLKYIISEKDLSYIYGEPVLSAEDYAAHAGMTVDELMEATFSDEYKDLTAADINVYLNKYALSLAFAADESAFDINLKDYNIWSDETDEKYNPDGYTSPFTRINALITAMLGEDETIEVFKPAKQEGQPTITNGVTATESSNHYKYEGSKGEITYTYTVPKDVSLFLYFPSYYTRGIKLSSSTMSIFDDTKSLDKCNERIVNLGWSKSTSYKLKVTINNTNGDKGGQFYTMLEDSFVYYVDMEVFEDVIERLSAEQMVMDETYKDDDINGTITTLKDNRSILTTIPYDAGWEVYVDGVKVETKEALNSLVAFEIAEAGEHDIRFLYRPTTYTVGITVTIASCVIFILIIIFEKYLKKLWIVKNVFVVGYTEEVGIGAAEIATAKAPALKQKKPKQKKKK
ncbi:MAG: YfhO family protein, partial [Clostridia bacterium]|nr:YfhO family protein [Clostridia bacterium]